MSRSLEFRFFFWGGIWSRFLMDSLFGVIGERFGLIGERAGCTKITRAEILFLLW